MQSSGNNNPNHLEDDPVFRALVGDSKGSPEERQSLLAAIEKAADAACFLDQSILDRHCQASDSKHQLEPDSFWNPRSAEDEETIWNPSLAILSPSVLSFPNHSTPNQADWELESETSSKSPTGKRLGDYVLLEKIGQGGFSSIYKGYHCDRPDEPVAVKVFKNHWLDSIGRLEIEAYVLRKLQHPNLVRALDAGCEQGVHFLVLNLVDGTSLQSFLETNQLEFDELVKFFLTIAQALAYAHEHEVVHRDLKPSNIMVTTEGQPVVTDFGLAKRLDFSQINQSMTASGALIGTLGYLAPEQATGNKYEVTRATDIYGLGATLYYALTGQPPMARNNLLQALQELKQKLPEPPRSFNPEIPLDLQLICLKCLEKLPHDRYESMEDLANELQRFLDRQPILARPVKWTVSFGRWCQANPLIAALSFGLLAALVGALIITLFLSSQVNRRWHQSQDLLAQANSILRIFDRSAEQMLANTSDSLEYRYERLKQSILFREKLAALSPDEDQDQYDLAVARFMLGKVCIRRGMHQEGHENYLIAIELFRDAAAKNPSDPQLQFDVFHALLGLYQSSNELELLEENRCFYIEQALPIIEKLVEEYPENTYYRDALACALSMFGGRMLDDDPARGVEYIMRAYRTACELKQQLSEPCLEWRHVHGTANRLSWHCLRNDNIDGAENWWKIGYEATEEFLNRPDRDPQEFMDLAQCFQCKFYIEQAKGNFVEAEKWKEKWKTEMTAWSRLYPDHFVFSDVLKRIDEHFKRLP